MSSHSTIHAHAATGKVGNAYYWILIALVCAHFTYRFFFQPIIIGHDSRHTVFIVLLPMAFGLAAFALYYRKALARELAPANGMKHRAIMFVLYLLQGLAMAYFSAGQLAAITWDRLCVQTAAQNEQQVVQGDITLFYEGRKRSRSCIEFTLNNRHEEVKVDRQFIQPYKDKNPADYFLELGVRKGIWDSSVVEYYKINPKQILNPNSQAPNSK